jgi:phosphate starvation-inducible PhoH-like protein
VHGVGGKIIKAMTPNQQLLVDTINKNDIFLQVRKGKTYTESMAVKALKENK